MKNIITVKDKEHLKELIKDEINLHGDKCDLNHLDVSNVTNMKAMFYNSKFNGVLSKWDVSKVTDMNWMFHESKFNGELSKWDVSNVKNMDWMFYASKFKDDLSDWLPYKLEDKIYMFDKCSAPTPYWYTAEDTKKAIESYQLKNKLEDKLSDIKKNVKKIKI